MGFGILPVLECNYETENDVPGFAGDSRIGLGHDHDKPCGKTTGDQWRGCGGYGRGALGSRGGVVLVAAMVAVQPPPCRHHQPLSLQHTLNQKN